MSTFDLGAVPGVPETVLPREVVQRLPATAAPAPWTCTAEAIIWTTRGGAAATRAVPEEVRRGARAFNVVGGMVRYTDTPVGPYNEVFGFVTFRSGFATRGNVAFMAVDSDVSVVGGRGNWSMPKTVARFDGDIDTGVTAVSETGLSWTVGATPRALGVALPMRSSYTILQRFPDGVVRQSKMRMGGRAKPALITVDVDSEGDLPTWLRPGRRLGTVVSGFTLSVDEPEVLR